MLLTLCKVGKVFRSLHGDRHVLSNISVSLQQGEAIALMGANGVGKSTLAGIIAGIDADFEGEVQRAPGLATQAPMIFQDFRASLLPWLTIENNIAFPLMLKGVPSEERREMVHAVVSRAPNRLDLSTPIRKLSGGQAQLVCILRALVVSPKLLICDEPFSAIDYPARMMLRALIHATCRAAEIALVFVSHSIEDAMFLADRVLILGGEPAGVAFDIPVGGTGSRDEDWLDTGENIALRRQLREALSNLGANFA